MRILQVTPYFAPAWAYGGPPRTVFELSRELAKRGHAITVVTTDAMDRVKRARPARERIGAIDVLRLPNLSNTLAWRGHLFLPVGTTSNLRGLIRDFDVIHFHMFRTLQNVIIHRLAEKLGIPYVLSAHGSLARIVRARGAKWFFDGLVGQRIVQNAKRVVALSMSEKSDYERAGVSSSRVSVVPNGIDPEPFSRLPVQGALREMYGLDGKRLVTFVGRLNARKGIEHLLQAFSEMRETDGNLHLLIAGPDDGYRRTLKALTRRLGILPHVTFTGMITESWKIQALVDSEVVVYPSRDESFGLVPFEALLCHRPVVVTGDSGCGELIEQEGAGFTAPFGDARALRDAIARTLEGGLDVREAVHRGRQFVLRRLNWGRIARRIVNIYEPLPATPVSDACT